MKIELQEIQRQMLLGLITVQEAISQMDGAIGGIQRVVYKDGRLFKIASTEQIFPLQISGTRKQQPMIEALACFAYRRAQKNGSIQPGEVHISKDASTKHHMDGIYTILSRYAS